MRSHFLSALTYPVQLVVGLLAYRKVQQTLYGQGTGRFSAEEIRSFRQQVWEYVHALLIASKGKSSEAGDGDAIFWVLGGDGPTEADTVIFGFIVSALVCTAYAPNKWRVSNCATKLSSRGPESWELVTSLPTVIDYAERIHNRYFPDYPRWK